MNWALYDIYNPWEYPFTAFNEDTTVDPDLSLGTTYDSATTSIPASCGVGDEGTAMIQEYVTYNTPYVPQCGEFSETLTDPYFTFAQLNSSQYSWAILRQYFITEIDALHGLATVTVDSAYRNPAKEYTVSIANGGVYHSASRHQYGDAIDAGTTQSTWLTYQADGHQLDACVEPISVQGGSYAHAHLDWRTQATVGPTYLSCPRGW